MVIRGVGMFENVGAGSVGVVIHWRVEAEGAKDVFTIHSRRGDGANVRRPIGSRLGCCI